MIPSLSKFHLGSYIPKTLLLYNDILCPNKWRWNLLRYDKTDEYKYVRKLLFFGFAFLRIYENIYTYIHMPSPCIGDIVFPYGWISDRYLWNISLTPCEWRMRVGSYFRHVLEINTKIASVITSEKKETKLLWFWNLQISALTIKIKAKIWINSAVLTM